MEYLKYFITEDIYLVPDKRHAKTEKKVAPTVEEQHPKVEAPQVKKEAKKLYPLTVICSSLNDAEKDLLDKILNAVKVSPANVQLLTNQKDTPDSQKVLVFGLDYYPSVEAYKIDKTDNKSILKAHTLKEINQDVEKKKALWGSLKQFFNV